MALMNREHMVADDFGLDIIAQASLRRRREDGKESSESVSESDGLMSEDYIKQDSGSEWEEAMHGDSDPLNEAEADALTTSVRGLYLMYALVGINSGFFGNYISIPICQYVFGPMGEPGRTSVQQCNIATSVIYMPWSFKVFYGFFIDSYPMFGSPRKNYIIMGWALALLTLLGMSMFAASLAEQDGGFQTYVLLAMFQCVFYMFADVAGDGMCVELTKLEPDENRGRILTTGQMVRFASTSFVSLLGVFFMNGPSYLPKYTDKSNSTLNATDTCGKEDPGLVFDFEISFRWIHAVLFAVQLPVFLAMCYYLKDPPRELQGEHMRKRQAIRIVWTLFKTKAVFFLTIFFYGQSVFAYMQSPAAGNIANIAQPTTLQYSVGNIIGNILFLVGVWVFRNYMIHVNWRLTFVWTSLMMGANAGLMILMIYNAWGIGQSGWFYVLGGNMIQFIQGIAQLVISLATAELAPPGLESTVFETLISITNGASTLGQNVMNMLIPYFHLNDINAGTYFPCASNPDPPQAEMNANMANATYTTMVINIAGTLIFAWFFPGTKEQTEEWRDDKSWHKKSIGIVGVTLGAGGFLFSVLVSFLSLSESTSCLKIAGGSGCE